MIWIFERAFEERPGLTAAERDQLVTELLTADSPREKSIYWLLRPKRGLPAEAPTLIAGPGCGTLVARELGLRYRIRTTETRHPGIFLDHEPLRDWLIRSGEARGAVLNTFAYTGSLSLAAALGGKATSVLTLDLSRATIDWARENWGLNAGTPGSVSGGLIGGATGDFIYGDVFDWLPRFGRQGRKFDTLILDPPSFSRAKSGNFSTEKDLGRLHELAVSLLSPGGLLISSINSETISPTEFEGAIARIGREAGRRFRFVRTLAAEPTGFPGATHLKGAAVRFDQ